MRKLLFIFVLLPGVTLLNVATVYAQDFEYEDDYDSEIKEKKTDTSSSKIDKSADIEEVKEKTESEYEDKDFDSEDDKSNKEDDENEQHKKKLIAEQKKKLQQQQLEAEKRIRAQRALEEKRRQENTVEKQEKRELKKKYSSYFLEHYKKMNFTSRIPSRKGFSFSFHLGFSPNLGNSAEEGFTFNDYITFLNLFGESTSLSNKYLNQIQNKGLAQIANGFQTLVYDLRRPMISGSSETSDAFTSRLEGKANITTSSASINTFPIGISGSFESQFFMTRLGVNFSWSTIGIGGTNKYTACSGTANACESSDASLKTNDVNFYVEHRASMMRLEVPLTFAVKLLSSKSFGAYIGPGVNFFWGRNQSSIESNFATLFDNSQLQTESDVYSSIGFGFHFLLGIEAQIREGIYLTVEIFQNFGVSDLVSDSDIDAVEANGKAEAIQINFSGTEILLGMKFYL